MRTLYPSIEPYHSDFLKVSDTHSLYYEQCGDPQGHPIVFLHGGPGAGISPGVRSFFDPDFYRIILFDQRGCGKSTPYASIEANTTWDLVDDMERLRTHLGIERWVVFGGSWGSTLALAYAIRHPDRVIGLILRGIYLGRPWENAWLFQEGASYFFPERWKTYLATIPEEERDDLIHAYHHYLNHPDQQVCLNAAGAWSSWESAIAQLIPNPEDPHFTEDPLAGLAIARIENHYFVNNLFFPSDNYLLENAPSIAHIPCRIVHGRYDLICPVRNAFELVEKLPHAELRVVPDAGHTAREPGIASELVQAADDFKVLFS